MNSGTSDAPWLDEAAALLRLPQPLSVLTVAPPQTQGVAALQRQFPAHRWRNVHIVDSLDPLAGTGVCDVALVVDTLEHLDFDLGERLLARLRDVLARQICLVLRPPQQTPGPSTQWTPSRLAALGFNPAGRTAARHAERLYHYDVATYKADPDWLNSRHWANPQRWNKARW